MTRVKRGTTSNKHRRNVLKLVKGYRHGRSSKERQAKEAIFHAGVHAFRDRRRKKSDFRRLWQIKIGAACLAGRQATQSEGLSYSKFIHALKQKNIGLNRKVLSELAEHKPDIFKKVYDKAVGH